MATNTKASSAGLSSRARTILISVASGISTGGVILQLSDANDTGADDETGSALQVAAEVFRRAGTSGQAVNRNDILKAIADGIYTRIGLEPLENE